MQLHIEGNRQNRIIATTHLGRNTYRRRVADLSPSYRNMYLTVLSCDWQFARKWVKLREFAKWLAYFCTRTGTLRGLNHGMTGWKGRRSPKSAVKHLNAWISRLDADLVAGNFEKNIAYRVAQARLLCAAAQPNYDKEAWARWCQEAIRDISSACSLHQASEGSASVQNLSAPSTGPVTLTLKELFEAEGVQTPAGFISEVTLRDKTYPVSLACAELAPETRVTLPLQYLTDKEVFLQAQRVEAERVFRLESLRVAAKSRAVQVLDSAALTEDDFNRLIQILDTIEKSSRA